MFQGQSFFNRQRHGNEVVDGHDKGSTKTNIQEKRLWYN